MNAGEIAKLMDYSLLKASATEREIAAFCRNARKYGFHALCVNSCWVKFCKRMLGGSGVKVAATAGYPLGAMGTRAKAEEARHAILDGADEIDAVMNVGWFLSGGKKTCSRT